jgi:hypothetical protein
MRNFIEAVIQIGALASKRHNDNKIAVGIKVDDILEPIYFYKYDGSYHITTQVRQRDKVEPTKEEMIRKLIDDNDNGLIDDIEFKKQMKELVKL